MAGLLSLVQQSPNSLFPEVHQGVFLSSRIRLSLDGLWNFCPSTPALSPSKIPFNKNEMVENGGGTITVPAPWQADPRFRDLHETAWYQHEFVLPDGWLEPGRVAVFGFGAIDYFAEVWLNGVRVGSHEGGYLPFEFDVTASIQQGINTVTVRVDDPLGIFSEIPHGKQSWYGMLSGIWQPVWIESRPATHIQHIKITPQTKDVNVEVKLTDDLPAGITAQVFAPDGELVTRVESNVPGFSLQIDRPLGWSPDAPNLYTLKLCTSHDEVSETFGFRSIETHNGQILLNGRPFYLRAALDQDYYPDLIYTPPSQKYIEEEFVKAKAMGFNCLRVHIKVADPRYYAAADKIGLLIWTELPNHILLSDAAKRRARETLAGMVERDWNHPCIGIWTLINESWGIDLTDPAQRAWLVETYDWLKKLDPTRLVVGNSACWGNFHVVTDLADFHMYKAMPDHAQQWSNWMANYARRPNWIFAHSYDDHTAWREFSRRPWNAAGFSIAPEVRQNGAEPLLVSEFGNWGLPDIDRLVAENGGNDPWWFDTGLEWGEGVVYPHGVGGRFKAFHLDKIFPSLLALSRASQMLQFSALKYEIEQIRQHPSIQGYVITELTDVNWEANGLLDINRNPKAYYPDLPQINADNFLIPLWERIVFSAGETCAMTILYSHYSPAAPENAVLEWRTRHPESNRVLAQGDFPAQSLKIPGVTELGRITFSCPPVETPTKMHLELRLVAGEAILASNIQEWYAIPSTPASRIAAALTGKRIYAPEFQDALQTSGCVLVQNIFQAEIAILSALLDEARAFLLNGGRILLLAEHDKALQTHIPGIQIIPRAGSLWQGDWVSSFGWHTFKDIPTGGVINFAFTDLTPEHLILGFAQRDFSLDVFAGLFVGWIHKPVPVIARRRVGRGALIISTLRLAHNLAQNPLADHLFRELLDLILKETAE
ncbi:MAG: sugar-binding domain-containing protein [Chloroflexota bacterium]